MPQSYCMLTTSNVVCYLAVAHVEFCSSFELLYYSTCSSKYSTLPFSSFMGGRFLGFSVILFMELCSGTDWIFFSRLKSLWAFITFETIKEFRTKNPRLNRKKVSLTEVGARMAHRKPHVYLFLQQFCYTLHVHMRCQANLSITLFILRFRSQERDQFFLKYKKIYKNMLVHFCYTFTVLKVKATDLVFSNIKIIKNGCTFSEKIRHKLFRKSNLPNW